MIKSPIPVRSQVSSALHAAAFDCDLERLQQLTEEGADLNEIDDSGVSVLCAIVASQHAERMSVAQWLLEQGARINLVARNGDTAAHLAARLGDTQMLSLLCTQGARLSQHNEQHQSVLAVACSCGMWPAAELLLNHDAEINPERGAQPLHEAAMLNRDDTDGVSLLLRYGADVNRRGRLGRTALMAAAMRGNADVAEALLKAGAQINARDDFGNTALMEAARSGANEVLERFVFWNPDTEYRDKPGRTALLVAVSSTRANAETVRLLIAMGAAVEVKNRDGRLAGDLAAAAGRWRIADALGVRSPSTATVPARVESESSILGNERDTVVIDLASFETSEDREWAARQAQIAGSRRQPESPTAAAEPSQPAPPPLAIVEIDSTAGDTDPRSAPDPDPDQEAAVSPQEGAGEQASDPQPEPEPDPQPDEADKAEPDTELASDQAPEPQPDAELASEQAPEAEPEPETAPEAEPETALQSESESADDSDEDGEQHTDKESSFAELTTQDQPDESITEVSDELPPFELVPPADIAVPAPLAGKSADDSTDPAAESAPGLFEDGLLAESDYQAALAESEGQPDLGEAIDAGPDDGAIAEYEGEPETVEPPVDQAAETQQSTKSESSTPPLEDEARTTFSETIVTTAETDETDVADDTDEEDLADDEDEPRLTEVIDLGEGDAGAVDQDQAGVYEDDDEREQAGYSGLVEAAVNDDTEQLNVILLSQPEAPQWWLAEAFMAGLRSGSVVVPRWLLDNGLEGGAETRDGEKLLQLVVREEPLPFDVVTALLSHGARPTGAELTWICGRAESQASERHDAMEDQRVDLVEKLLELGADPEVRDSLGRSALHWAAMYRDKRTVALLLKREADVNQTDEGGNTPLMLALEQDRPARLGVMRELMQAGADAHLANQEGVSPIAIAMAGDDATVQGLLMRGAARQREAPTVDFSPGQLTTAAADGNLGRVKRMLAREVDVNEMDANRRTPLMRAAGGGHATVVSALLAAGADANIAALNGTTALGAAVLGNHPEVVKLLVDRGTDVDQRQQYGITPLMLAAARWLPRMVRTLISLGADVSARDETQGSVMMAAVQNALHSSDETAGEATVRELLKHGADVNAVNDEGQTALMLLLGVRAGEDQQASGNIVSTLSALLIEHEAELDIQDMAGWTALHAAAARGLLEPTQAMLAAGANKRLRDINGLSPCDLAMNHSHEKLVDLFLAS